MDENKNCHCPICKQQFEPKEGTSPTEHLISGILSIYADMQRKASSCDCASNLPCPRCGKYSMSDNVYRNALSRVGGNDIHVCDSCGTIQSLESFKGESIPLTSWYVVSEILNTNAPIANRADTPFGECVACGYEFNSELISEYEIKCCPNCGKRIEQ